MVQFTGHANGRVGFPPPCCRSGSRNCEKGRRRMGEQGMTCLYECLREVGLQRYYARFISMGVCRVTHLSALTMEEYPILGIQSMKDRTSLFHLVQLVKTLNPESHEDDDDYDPDAYRSEKNRAACEGSFINGVDASCEDRDDEENGEDNKKKAAIIKNNTDSHRGPFSVRRRLDFSGEMTDPHPNCMGSSLDSAKVFARHQSGNNQRSDQGRVSVMQMQHESDTPTVGCGSKDPTRNGNADIYRRSSAHRPGENTKPDVTRHSCIYGSQAPSTKQPSPGLMTTHKLSSKPHRNYNPRCTTVTSTRPSSKPTSHKRRKTVSRRLKPGPGREDHENWRPTDKPVVQSERRAGYNYGLPLNSLPLPNKLKTGEQRIRVCVRKRPLTHTEEVRGEADIVTTQDAECVVVYESKEAVDLTQYILQHRFYFDQVFGEESSNEEVYQRTAYPLVQHMLNGGKATCFAYGQTGAGKTHTMLGCSPGRPGLYALAAHDIFTHLCATHTPSPMLVYVSFFEIYCGQLYDLLDHRKRLFAREDGKKMVQITGLREFRVDSVDSLLEVISWGTEERTQGVSGVNPVSSRSHALLQIQLRSLKQQLAGRMWFVDLAGSERAADTREPDRQSRIEGAEINQSLLALKECIRSLDQEQSHTPFRQSKLTQVLKDSFVGNSKTCMIANISPGHLATEHTLNTLRYADRVKELKGRGRGARGGPRSKISALPKPIKTNGGNTSGGNSREKSPPKKPKLSNRGTRFPETPTGTASTPAAMFFSTPKKSLAGKRRGRGALKDEIGTYCHLTPVASSLGMSDARTKQEILGERNERAERGSSRRRDKEGRYGGTECADHTNRDSNTATEKDERQPTKEQNFSCDVAGEAAASAMPLSVAQKPSGFRHSGVERRKNTWEREGEERTCRDQRRQVRCESGNGRDSLAEKSGRRGCRENSAKLEGRPGEHWQTGGEREKERENHLRWYHQQLQQCLPSAFSQSPLSPSPFVSPSLSSSGQPNVSASLSLAAPSAIPPAMYHSLKDLLEVYRASVEVRGHGGGGHVEHHGGISQIDFPASESHNTKDNGADKTVALGEKSGVPLKKAETGDGEWRGEREEEGGLLEVARRGERGERRDGLRPMEVAKSRWAWVKTTATEEADRTMDAALSEGEVSECSSFDSEETWRREATAGVTGVSDVVVEEDYSANEKEEVGGKHFGFTHSRDYPTQDHPQHLAPAERPLSPAHNASGTHPTDINLGDLSLEPKDNNHCTDFLSLPLQYAALAFPPRDVPLNSTSGVSGFLINREISNFTLTPPLCRPFTTPSTNEGPDPTMVAVAKIAAIESYPGCPIYSPSWVKTSVSPPVRSSADDCGCNTDPLSLSSPQVDRQAATANKTVMVDNYTQPKRDMLNGADFLLEIGKTKPHIPGAALVSLQYEGNDEGSGAQPGTKALRNKICASLPKRPPHPTQSHVQSISHHDQCRGDTVSLRPHVQVSEASTEKASEYLRSAYNQTLSSVTVRSESDLNHLKMAARQSHSLLACHSNDPQSPLKVRRPSPTECTGSHQSPLENTSNRHIRPTISSSEDWGHAQWCVVKAQLKQLQEMEALCHKDGTLLCQQEYMAFGEYVHRLEEIMERKACCIQSMKNWLHRYLVPTLSGHQNSKDQTPDTLSSETGISVL